MSTPFFTLYHQGNNAAHKLAVLAGRKRSQDTSPPTRTLKVPIFGGVLREARGARSLGQVAPRIGISRSALFQLEKGTVVAPDPVLLHGIAGHYGISLEELIKLLKWNREHPEATKTPKPSALEEGDMRVIGEDRYFIDRFRKLPAHARREVLNFIDFKTQHPEVAATSPFRESKRARKTPR